MGEGKGDVAEPAGKQAIADKSQENPEPRWPLKESPIVSFLVIRGQRCPVISLSARGFAQ
jgi:hypothetical protein